MAIQDTDLLTIIKNEKVRSLGFDVADNGFDLQAQRNTALDYYKGDMRLDMPHLPGRSGVTDSAVADAIEQVLPDLVEIFLEEDVVSFNPENEADMDAAAQETDYVNHVIFKQNNGFEILQQSFRDALLVKTGVWYWYWEDGKHPKPQVFTGQTILDVKNATDTAMDQIVGGDAGIVLENPAEIKAHMKKMGITDPRDPQVLSMSTFTFTLQPPKGEGRVVIKSWAPEDIAVSDDTKKLGEGTYCGFRTRMRRQELLEDGYDPDIVESLPHYGNFETTLQYARDTVGESQANRGSIGTNDMDLVQIYYHYVKVFDEGRIKLFRVTTGGEEVSILLKREEVDSVPASAITPFPIPHRFYGMSLADKTLEVQRIKTALLRMALDSGYFAMNQRMQVAETGVSKHTLSDILNNTPGAPIRMKTIGAVAPVVGGQLNFDPFNALEYVSTLHEQRSGISRNQQGLNPDSLHETAGGALAQMAAGARRVRYIARNFAESGFKEMCIGVHKMLRENSTIEQVIRLRGKWVPINPGKWHLRDDVDIEIGNNGGRDYDIITMNQVINIQKEAVQAQGGLTGPLTNPQLLLASATKLVSRMGIKNPDLYFPDPNSVDPNASAGGPAGAAAAAAQAQQQAKQAETAAALQKTQMTLAQKAQEANQDYEIKKNEVMQAHYQQTALLAAQQAKMQADQSQFEQEMQFKREQMLRNIELEQQALSLKYAQQSDQITAELDLKRQIAETEAEIESQRLHISDENSKLAILNQQEQADKDRAVEMVKHIIPPAPAMAPMGLHPISNPTDISVSADVNPKLPSLDGDFALKPPTPPKP